MNNSAQNYNLEKTICIQKNHEQMGWHDCSIYGLFFETHEEGWSPDLVFDIDYIF